MTPLPLDPREAAYLQNQMEVRRDAAVFEGDEVCALCLRAWEIERAKLIERIERIEARNSDWLKRVSEAVGCCVDVEFQYQGSEDMSSEDWVSLSHAARVMEDLERDMRSDLF